ncbi:hypothetical protein FPV67DRAFT_582605 [Lyophyllum atratum]|nr:hypothetical protein FPV67DRAFT_582605 [Lyophyllum atratum]
MPSRLAKSEDQPTRSSDFWLHDGSIVLAVGKTLFRVHQTILANHSEIFADLFSLPQPEGDGDGETRVEGCPVVELHDDADDFDDLMKAIYHPSHFDKLSPSADLDALLTFIGGILRLSTKYVINELRKRCTALLVARFPTSYQEYLATGPKPYTPTTVRSPTSDNSTSQDDTSWSNTVTFTLVPTPQSQASSSTAFQVQSQPQPQPQPSPFHSSTSNHSNSHPSTDRHGSRSRRHSSHHHRDRDRDRDRDTPKHKPKDEHPPKPKGSSIMRAIALANETNILTILPYAYYLLARTSDPRRYLSHSPSSALSWHQKTLTLVGRAHLHTAEVSMSHAFLVAFEPAPTCVAVGGTCKNARGPLVEWALLGTTGRGPEPLRPWERWEKLGVCLMCVGHARRRHERGREEVWNRLPEFFELGSWSRLRSGQES